MRFQDAKKLKPGDRVASKRAGIRKGKVVRTVEHDDPRTVPGTNRPPSKLEIHVIDEADQFPMAQAIDYKQL